MKISSFFKILNRKIEKYDKMATNPFMQPQSFILVWIEEAKDDLYQERDDSIILWLHVFQNSIA